MAVGNINIAVWSNNSFFEEYFLSQVDQSDFNFEDLKNSTASPYVLVLVDISADLTNISQKIISIYDQARQKDQKLAVLLIHSEQIDQEKNLYFSNLLDGLAGGKPIHRLVFVKDLYQPELLIQETFLEKLILDSLIDRKISISRKGDRLFFPLTLSDLAHGLKKTYFLNGTAGKSFWLLGDPISDLELSYLIKKYLEDSEGPEFEIDADGEIMKTSLDLNALGNQSRALLGWAPIDDFPEILRTVVKRVGSDQSQLLSKIHKIHLQHERPKLQKFLVIIDNLKYFAEKLHPKKGMRQNIETAPQLIKKVLEYLLFLVFAIYLIFSISFIGFTAMSLKYLERSLTGLRQADINQSVKDLKTSKTLGEIGESSYTFISPILSLVSRDLHNKNHHLFIFMHYTDSSLGNLQQTYQLAEKIYQTIGSDVPGQFYTDSSLALRSNLSQIYENLNQIELLTGHNKLPKIVEDKLNTSAEFKNLKLVEQQIIQVLKASELIPAFLAGDSAKNIAVLFQNSQEIRSTGGTIDYLMALVLEHGRVVSRKIYRADEIDTLAEDLVPAPPLVKLYTGSEFWKVRDLNYNPDFPQTATNISWFLEKTLKFKTDVIVAVNDQLINELIGSEKGLILNGQTIATADLTKELTTVSPSPLYHQLIDHYVDQILTHKLPLLSLGRVVASQSERNQVLFWTADDQIEESIINQPYSGAIYSHTCPSGLISNLCLPQTTYWNESNFSLIALGDKLQRQVVHAVWLEPRQIRHEYRVSYTFKESIPNLNRDLSQVIQIYAPLGSKLEKITLDEKDISLKPVLIQEDHQLTRFQIPLAISFNKDHNLVVSLVTPVGVPNLPPFAYSLTEYHQAGMSHETELNLNFPNIVRPQIITAPVVSGPNNLNTILAPRITTFGASFVGND